VSGAVSGLVQGVDKVASGPVGTEAHAVIGAAKVRLVLGVTVDVADFLITVRELAFLPVLASAVLLEGAAHLRLVAGGLGDWWGNRGGTVAGRRCLTLASVEQGTSRSNWAILLKARGEGISQRRWSSEAEAKWLRVTVRVDLNPQTLETVSSVDLSNHRGINKINRHTTAIAGLA